MIIIRNNGYQAPLDSLGHVPIINSFVFDKNCTIIRYLAPLEWLGHVHMVARNCWHPALHSNPRVLSIPFGKKKKSVPYYIYYYNLLCGRHVPARVERVERVEHCVAC